MGFLGRLLSGIDRNEIALSVRVHSQHQWGLTKFGAMVAILQFAHGQSHCLDGLIFLERKLLTHEHPAVCPVPDAWVNVWSIDRIGRRI